MPDACAILLHMFRVLIESFWSDIDDICDDVTIGSN